MFIHFELTLKCQEGNIKLIEETDGATQRILMHLQFNDGNEGYSKLATITFALGVVFD